MKTTSKSKKLISFIVSAAMTVSLIPANIAFADDVQYNTWTDAAAAAESGNDYKYDENGTYTVYSAKGLAYAACLVNGTVDNKEIEDDGLVKYPNINITLNNNIDLATAGVKDYGEDTITEENSWIPIGDGSNRYVGTFNGAGYSIENLYIKSERYNEVAFFSVIGVDGKVQNTTIASGSVNNCSSNRDNAAGGFASFVLVKQNCRDSGKSCVNSIKTNLLGENYGRNNFYQGGFST